MKNFFQKQWQWTLDNYHRRAGARLNYFFMWAFLNVACLLVGMFVVVSMPIQLIASVWFSQVIYRAMFDLPLTPDPQPEEEERLQAAINLLNQHNFVVFPRVNNE